MNWKPMDTLLIIEIRRSGLLSFPKFQRVLVLDIVMLRLRKYNVVLLESDRFRLFPIMEIVILNRDGFFH